MSPQKSEETEPICVLQSYCTSVAVTPVTPVGRTRHGTEGKSAHMSFCGAPLHALIDDDNDLEVYVTVSQSPARSPAWIRLTHGKVPTEHGHRTIHAASRLQLRNHRNSPQRPVDGRRKRKGRALWQCMCMFFHGASLDTGYTGVVPLVPYSAVINPQFVPTLPTPIFKV